ncbi:MAG: alpha/beta hydrolase-fold protein [Bacteroidota bacterium]
MPNSMFPKWSYPVCILAIVLSGCISQTEKQSRTEFILKYTSEVSGVPLSGRAILLLSQDTLKDPDIPEPGRPFITIGTDFENWQPGKELIINNDNSTGYISTVDELEGSYSARVLLDLDTTSCSLQVPGMSYSEMFVFHVKPGIKNRIHAEVCNVYPGRAFQESDTVKLLKVESQLLSNFYHASTNIEAAVFLPASYFEDTQRYYPTVFVFPGWGTTHAASSQSDFQMRRYGRTGYGEEKIFVVLNQDCRFGFHVFADSDNNGPRATSFVEEFLPFYEKAYRAVTDSRSRFLIGQSSGAWAALWLQTHYPDTFGMSWAGSPDPLDFRDFLKHNLYDKKANLFYDTEGILTPAIRPGEIVFTIKEWLEMESALGEGGQFQSFESVFGRRGSDNRPEQMFDRQTGKVSRKAMAHWKNYDINLFISENSEKLKVPLAGKINISVADNDPFFLDGPVKLLKKSLDSLGIMSGILLLPEGEHDTWTDNIRCRMHSKMDSIGSKK